MGLAGAFMLYHVGMLVRSTSKALASRVQRWKTTRRVGYDAPQK